MAGYIEKKRFSDIDMADPFFGSLKEDYRYFETWFKRKSQEEAYVLHSDEGISGFLYLKVEDGPVTDVSPSLPPARRIKIGTFKVDAHGTRLGERLVKKALDHAIAEGAAELYVTIFPKHAVLIKLLEEYGFARTRTKTTDDGQELVLCKPLTKASGVLRKDYPLIVHKGHSKFLLAIYPRWHTKLFPDSILKNETYDVVQDVSHTNSIQKTYVSFMDLSSLRCGDLVIIYRTSDDRGPASYRSVVTSVCTVEEIRTRGDFGDSQAYVAYTEPFSVFTEKELLGWWHAPGHLFVVKMLYSAAFSKRVIRKQLIESVGLDGDTRWGFLPLTDEQFHRILQMGGVDERLIVD